MPSGSGIICTHRVLINQYWYRHQVWRRRAGGIYVWGFLLSIRLKKNFYLYLKSKTYLRVMIFLKQLFSLALKKKKDLTPSIATQRLTPCSSSLFVKFKRVFPIFYFTLSFKCWLFLECQLKKFGWLPFFLSYWFFIHPNFSVAGFFFTPTFQLLALLSAN